MAIYFYKINEPYGCFSNFSPHGFELENKYWSTSEHYFQAKKFTGTENEELVRISQLLCKLQKWAEIEADHYVRIGN
jgi:ribA/ribD-fused uncharacterized protein